MISLRDGLVFSCRLRVCIYLLELGCQTQGGEGGRGRSPREEKGRGPEQTRKRSRQGGGEERH